jgi:Tfp pilus assembly protein PilF
MTWAICSITSAIIKVRFAEYKSAVALEPKSVDARVNLALSYQEVNQGDLAVQQLREAKKLDPNNFEVRRNLGSLLMHQNLYQML